MSWIKLISINLLIFVILLILIEGTSGLGRVILGKNFKFNIVESFTSKEFEGPSHPCNKMKTDVILSLVHDHGNECLPKSGKVVGEYVVYNVNKNDEKVILTLGGSTTSGFYQFISKGETWPKILAEKAGKEFKIYNGGVGGYSSTQELYKFIKDGARIRNLSYVISLSGINDIPDLHGRESIRAPHFPFMTINQFRMNQNQKWIDTRQNSYLDFFIPNLMSLVQRISTLEEGKEQNSNFDELNLKSIDTSERWQKNIERIHALVKLEGSNYFVFLQPTLGLEGVQSQPTVDTNDAILFDGIDNLFSGNYLNIIRNHYKELKKRCALLSYCIDISDIAPPTGDMYNDPRHHNENGNQVIAQKIWSVIKEHSNKNYNQ